MIEQEFRTLVDSKTTWTTYLNHAIENQSTPYVVVSKVTAPRSYTNDGRDGMVQARFQVSLFADDYKTVKEEAFKMYTIADASSSTIHFIVLENETDLYEAIGIHHVILDFIVNYYE